MQTYFEGDQVSLFDQDTSAGKTSWAYSAQARRTGRISGLSWSQLLDYIAPPYQFLDLTPGAGNLLGQFEWEMRSALHGGAFLRNTGPSPRDATESCLSQILEDHPPKKYYLTTAACLGILRRAEERGKPLPKALDTALRIQAGLIGSTNGRGKKNLSDEPVAFAQNQRDEVRDLHNIAGALGAQPGMKQQTFIASFSAGAGATAGTIGYAEEVAPTLMGSPSRNCMPSVMCLHDQGGQRMDVCENMTGTLRASEKGHQPLVYENHSIDARVRESSEISPTVTARYGTGGGNTPLVQEDSDVYCIVGNIIDRQPENGGNGCGYQQDLAYTLTALDGTRSLRASAWTSSRRMILPARRAHGRSRMLRIWLQNRNGNMRSSFEDLLHGNANSFKGSRWGGQISRPRRTLPDTVPSATVLPSRVWSSL